MNFENLFREAAAAAAGPTPSPADLNKILAQVIALLDALPPGGDPLRALKKPGAWRDVPIDPHGTETGVFIDVRQHPTEIDFVNVPAHVLKGQLTPVSDGSGGSKITVLPPLTA